MKITFPSKNLFFFSGWLKNFEKFLGNDLDKIQNIKKFQQNRKVEFKKSQFDIKSPLHILINMILINLVF